MRAGLRRFVRSPLALGALVGALGAASTSGVLLASAVSHAGPSRSAAPLTAHVESVGTKAPVVHAPATPARAATAHAAGFGTPSWISIPSVDIGESVRPQAPAGGVIEPPPDQVVWDSQTPEPGAVGASIVLGHDEWGGPSSFWNLDDVRPGARIAVRAATGTSLVFVVTGSKSERKTAAQYDRSLWQPDVSFPELIVVTCDKYSPVVDYHHLNNYIVYARELAATSPRPT